MSAPRILFDRAAVTHNARQLVDPLAARGITVTGVVKAVVGSPAVARAMLAGGVAGLGDSRVENLETLLAAGVTAPLTLTRSPMLSQVARVVRAAETSLNSEPEVVAALSAAALDLGRVHDVILMVELGDLREGLMAADVLDAARVVTALRGVRLSGLGTNLACRSGVAPDQSKMDELSRLVEQVEQACAITVDVVSGGNSANLEWALALGPGEAGRVNQLRLGEAILLGVEPLHRTPLPGLRTDAFSLVGEVIEARRKPAVPWGTTAQAAFGSPPEVEGSGEVNQVVLAVGRQDTDPAGLTPPPGVRVLAMSSDHLVLDAGDHDVRLGAEMAFGVDYSALLRAMTSPYVVLAPARAGEPQDDDAADTMSPPPRATPVSDPVAPRLRLGERGAGDCLDGGWWPHSRDLAIELADLAASFPPELGRIVRALYSPPDWDLAPQRIPVPDGYVKAGSFPGDDTHLMRLTMADGTVLRILVVPPALTDYQGAEALLAAASRGNSSTPAALLDTVTEFPEPDPDDHWSVTATGRSATP